MAVETITQVKRTIWVAACDHEKKIEVDDPGRRQSYCAKCDKWIPYMEETYTGPVINDKWSTGSRNKAL